MGQYQYTREDVVVTIRKLATEFPKCFFEDPGQRRPLKRNIEKDVYDSGFAAPQDLIQSAIDFYRTNFGYRRSLQAGARRIDLAGKEVDTVTEQEASVARRKYYEDKQRLSERDAQAQGTPVQSTPARIMAGLHESRLIPTDAIRKVDAPPRVTAAPDPMRAVSDLESVDALAEIVTAAKAALNGSSGTTDIKLRRVMAAAALDLLASRAHATATGFLRDNADVG